MKKKIIAFLILYITTIMSTQAQELTEKELIGKWKVVHAEALIPDVREEQKANYELMRSGFEKAKLEFTADKLFTLDIEFPDLAIKNAQWSIEQSTGTVKIEEWKDNPENKYVVMQLSATKEDNKTLFLVSNIFFLLEVIKE